MSTSTTTTVRYTLSCHVVMAPAGKAIGGQLRCPECSEAAGKTVRPRIKAIVNPTGDETVDAALGQPADELVDPFAGALVIGPAQVADAAAAASRSNGTTPGQAAAVSDMAKARQARLDRAKAAAAAGQDPAAVLAEPLPAKGKAKRAAKADAWCVRFRNMSAVRLDALRFAGWDHEGGPLVICDQQAAAAFTGLLTGALNRVSDLPQPTDLQRRTIEQMLSVARKQRAAAGADKGSDVG